MKKFILFFGILLISLHAQSHGFDYSVITLKEKENNSWSLHIKSSLDAFRKEVKVHFAKTPYTTPEEFNEQLLAHIKKTLILTVKDKPLVLGDGVVKLGHETSIYFNDIKIAKHARNIKIVNGALRDIYRHTTKLFVIEKGKQKKSYILKKTNNFTANLPIHNDLFMKAN